MKVGIRVTVGGTTKAAARVGSMVGVMGGTGVGGGSTTCKVPAEMETNEAYTHPTPPTAPTTVSGVATGWTANAGVVLPATGWGGADGVVNSIGLKITNQLFATSLAGGASEVWKNAASLTVLTSPVPEAETYAMMLAGLGLVGFMARRRSISVA